MDKSISALKPAELRTQAELKLALMRPPKGFASDSETKRLFHELQVHQIELEMQNEALRELVGANKTLEGLVAVRSADLIAATEALDAAKAAVEAKTAFLAAMSHELRTPLHAIMAMTALEVKNAKDEKQQRHLKNIQDASERLLGVINDILDFAKIEGGRMTLEQVEFTLSEVQKSVQNIVECKASEKGLQFHFQRPARIAVLPLCGDPLRIGQILINLAGNAVKFTDTGSVTVRISLAEETNTDVLARFEVEDTGVGIGEADQQRLFVAFEQADSSTTRRYGGSGLGLAISRQLTQMMQGKIGVKSKPGKGSTFWFTARIAKVAA